MKLRFKELGIIILILGTTLFIGCDKRISSAEFGVPLIYIPAAQQSGGVNLDYLVPSNISFDTTTNNFHVDSVNNLVNVYLGVNCSSLQQAGYTVNVSTRSDTIIQMINNGTINVAPDASDSVFLLPASAYTLPTSVTVPSGSVRATFNLAINFTTLKTYAGKKVALCVVISNPTNYALSPTLFQVIIIIDVNKLNL